MTNEERVRQVQNGVNVCENMTALWLDNQPLIKSIVNRYPEKDREDLMQEAYMGIYKAVQGYDAGKNAKFMSYAPYHIKNCINAYLNLDRPVSAPKYILVLMQRDKRVSEFFLQTKGRKPTDEERIKILDITQEQLDILDNTAGITFESMDRPLTGDNDRDLYDIVEGTSQNGEGMLNELEELQLKNALWKVVDSLPEIERNVIKARYQNNMTLKECGRVTGIGLSKARSSETRAINTLRKADNIKKLIQYLPDAYIYGDAIKGTGVGRFANTWTSATERVALGIGSSFRE